MQGRYWWELADHKFTWTKKQFPRVLIRGEKLVEYDENLSFVTEAVEKQLKLGKLIPKTFREFGVRIIERWWKEGHRWNQKGKGLNFAEPKLRDYLAYHEVWRKLKQLREKKGSGASQPQTQAAEAGEPELPCHESHQARVTTKTVTWAPLG